MDAGRKLRVGQAALGMRVHVDEAGRDVPPGGVHGALRPVVRQVAHRGDRVSNDAHVGSQDIRPRAVEDQPAAYGYLEVHRWAAAWWRGWVVLSQGR